MFFNTFGFRRVSSLFTVSPPNHLYQFRQHLYIFLYSTFIIVEVHIIQKFITQPFIRVTTISGGYDNDGGKFAGNPSGT